VVLDEGFAAGWAFGAGGAPSAVLVDAAGRIASPVAVGAQAVLALAAPIEVEGCGEGYGASASGWWRDHTCPSSLEQSLG